MIIFITAQHFSVIKWGRLYIFFLSKFGTKCISFQFAEVDCVGVARSLLHFYSDMPHVALVIFGPGITLKK